MNSRTLKIGLGAFAVTVAAFLIYCMVVDTPNIAIKDGGDDDKGIEIPDFDTEAGSVEGGLKLAPVGASEYIVRDELSKKIKRILGFEELLNPQEGSELWRLQKPYMKMFEDKFKCNIKSDFGKVRVETVLNVPTPVSAELTENVEILIQMKDDDRKIKICLENLIYDNERSEFTTKGPVTLYSEDGIMQGKGLILLYDANLGKLAYLEITDLEYLLLKNVKSSQMPDDDIDTTATAAASPASPDDSQVKVSPPVPVAQANESTSPIHHRKIADPDQEKYKYYQCSLDKNVNIEYGKKIVVFGADEIVISNILWSNSEENSPATSAASAKVASSDDAVPAGTDAVAENKSESHPATVTDVQGEWGMAIDSSDFDQNLSNTRHGENDIYVTCDGSLIVRPMELAGMKPERLSSDNRRRMQIKGRPVKVGQPADSDSDDIATIASCGVMTYDIDNEVLDLERGENDGFVELKMADKEACIFTEGSVKWRRRANHAVIVGPGMLLLSEQKNMARSPNMKFDGIMDVYFAQTTAHEYPKQLYLSNVDLVGGMVVTLNNDSDTVVTSDNAKFNFAEGREITRVDMDGNVNFKSNQGRVASNQAQILFAMNDAGKSEPVSVTSSGEATLEPAGFSKTAEPTRFHAKRIEYDVITGKAVAEGPVKFIFYPKQKQGVVDHDAVPVVITAQENAKYFPDQNQVVFNGDVVGTRVTPNGDIVQHETISGGKLIVDMIRAEGSGQSDDIKHIRVTGGVVKLRAQRTLDGDELGDIGLSCQQLDWGAYNNSVIAKGPGDIQIDNKNAPESTDSGGRLDLGGPCQAMISGFQSLVWDIDNSRLQADGGTNTVNIGYLPYRNGQKGQVVKASAGNIICDMEENADGRFELSSINTYNKIFYEEVGKHSIIGEGMEYNGSTGIMLVKGTPDQPCIVDGRARTSFIEYNMQTGTITSQLSK